MPGAKMGGIFGEWANAATFAKPPSWGGLKNQITQLQETKAT
jgi:hypothetical protein